MNIQKYELFVENLNNIKNIDFYILDDFSIQNMRNLYSMVKSSNYRAVATISSQIDQIEEFPCIKIVLINYPIERCTHHRFNSQLDEVLSKKVDEIEFPWQEQHLSWGVSKWRNIVIKCMNKGIILRPMLEIGIDTNDYIQNSVDFFKEIGITNVMTSTGLIPQVTSVEKWNEIKDLFPIIFNIKVSATIRDTNIADTYLNSGAKLIATSIDILN